MSFHTRWESGQLLSRIMNDLSTIRRFLGFGLVFIVVSILQIAVVVAILHPPLLAARAGGAGLDDSGDLGLLRDEQAYTQLSRRSRTRPVTWPRTVEEAAHGLRAIKSFGRATTSSAGSTRAASDFTTRRCARVRLQAKFWTFLGVIPSVTLIVVLSLGALAAGQDQRHPGHAGRLHHADDVAGLAGDGARVPAVDDPGGDDRRRPDR